MSLKFKKQESTSAETDVNLKSIDNKLDLILNQLSDMNQLLFTEVLYTNMVSYLS